MLSHRADHSGGVYRASGMLCSLALVDLRTRAAAAQRKVGALLRFARLTATVGSLLLLLRASLARSVGPVPRSSVPQKARSPGYLSSAAPAVVLLIVLPARNVLPA